MKTGISIFEKLALGLLISLAVLSILGEILMCPLFLSVTLSMACGNLYCKAGETTLYRRNGTEQLNIYRKKGKPFLIVGPCLFEENYRDFFFVRPKQVMRSGSDESGEEWYHFGPLLLILDDFTIWDSVRMPYWDDLEATGSSVRFDPASGNYLYTIILNAREPVSFAIPGRLFSALSNKASIKLND